jgi:hypothetical protein
MNIAQSEAPAPHDDEPAHGADATSHRRRSDVENPSGPVREHDDEEHLHGDDVEEVEQEDSSDSMDETDVLSEGGPDSIEDVEGGDDLED